MSAVGFADDRRAMPASLKLFFEAVCAFAAAFIMGFSGPLQLIFAVTLVVFITNAVNLTDGIDGLCSAESCVCLFALSLLGLPVLPLLPFCAYDACVSGNRYGLCFFKKAAFGPKPVCG